MKCIPLSFDVNLRPGGFLVDLDSLFAALAELEDRRDARGLRYALVTVLAFLLLTKVMVAWSDTRSLRAACSRTI